MKFSHYKTKQFFYPLLFLVALTFLNSLCAANEEYYVSPAGSDQNPGTLDKPFLTIQKARDTVRAITGKSGNITINLRGGLYSQTEPIEFTPADSGLPNAPITYKAYKNEVPVISGGKKIEGGWKKSEGKSYFQISVPGAGEDGWFFHNLYVNGKSATRARTPNYDEKVYRAEGYAPNLPLKKSLRFYPGQIQSNWSDVGNIDVIHLMVWTPVHHRIDKINFADRSIEFLSDGGMHQVVENNFRFYLANVFEGLDSPGEWYLDRKTGTLYYYPRAGEDMAKAEVIAPVLKENLVRFSADPLKGEKISYLRFEGIHFLHTDTDRLKWNSVYRQGHMYLSAAIIARGLTHSVFSGCVFKNLGEYAMELGAGCQNNKITGSFFTDLGAGGIQLGISTLKDIMAYREALSPGNVERGENFATDVLNNIVENNLIHQIGNYWHGCYAIVNRFASYTKIIHNEIFDTHWDAIASDARWVYKGENYSVGNVIAYNYLHDIGRGYLSDAACYYQFGPLDTHIHHNIIRDTVAYKHVNSFKGIYLDEQSRGAIAENNLIYNIDGVGLNQHWGSNNIYRNNIVAFTKGGANPGRLGNNYPETATKITIERNIFLGTNGIALDSKGVKTKGIDIIRNNLFWDMKEKNPTFWQKSLTEWQKEFGIGEGTIIADPGFKDPLRYDFSLPRINEDLKKIGFVPFTDEIKKAGLLTPEMKKIATTLSVRPPVPQWTTEEVTFLSLNINLDFEEQKPGEFPTKFNLNFDEKAGAVFQITDKVAASGKHSLVMIDKAAADKSWLPFLNIRNFKADPAALRIKTTFSVRHPESDPAEMGVEFRGPAYPADTGPSLRIQKSGAIIAGKENVGSVSSRKWTQIEMIFGKGLPAGYYYLAIGDNKNKSEYVLPFVGTLPVINWFGFAGFAKEDGTAYIDDVSIEIFNNEISSPKEKAIRNKMEKELKEKYGVKPESTGGLRYFF